MKPYTITIRDVTAWTITLLATDSLDAEDRAWKLFQDNPNRSDLFEDDSDTTVQVEEVQL